MSCPKCKTDRLINVELKCAECEIKHCTKCLKIKNWGLYCEICLILTKHPPNKLELMKLKPMVLLNYLKKRNVSIAGLKEKPELVEKFCLIHTPDSAKISNVFANFKKKTQSQKATEEQTLPRNATNFNNQQRTSNVFQQNPNVRATNFSSSERENNQTESERIRSSPIPDINRPSTSQENIGTTDPLIQETNRVETNENIKSKLNFPRLVDYSSVEELDNLSSKDLKILLSLYRVDFKVCLEKKELLEMAHKLWLDNQALKKGNPDNLPSEELCKICLDAPIDCVLLECGHIATCLDCGKQLSECPICRQYITRVKRIFKA